MEKVQEEVSIVSSYNTASQEIMPRKMQWRGRVYQFIKLGYYHRVRIGRIIFHYFHMTDGATDFRLALNAENLHWTLEQISHDS